MPAIDTDGLTRRFGDLVAVDALDLSVEEGEVFGFLGPNGAGKSTTINMLLGFLHPSEGSATVLGCDAIRHSQTVRQHTGLLPEGFAVYENLTGREHVASAIETKDADDDPDALLDRVGLDPQAAHRAAGGYSKGMEQRLALAIALVGDPALLVLDEPSTGLDPKGAKLLRQIVREEADRGATVFFSSHILGQVEQVCDRVGIMAGGEMVAVDTIDALRDQIGAESVIEAEANGTPDQDAVGAVHGVRDVTVTGDTVRITCTHPTAKMPALRALNDTTRITDITIEDASLEALFEQYTESGGEDTPLAGGDGATPTGDSDVTMAAGVDDTATTDGDDAAPTGGDADSAEQPDATDGEQSEKPDTEATAPETGGDGA